MVFTLGLIPAVQGCVQERALMQRVGATSIWPLVRDSAGLARCGMRCGGRCSSLLSAGPQYHWFGISTILPSTW
jgi:hypothetical protein